MKPSIMSQPFGIIANRFERYINAVRQKDKQQPNSIKPWRGKTEELLLMPKTVPLPSASCVNGLQWCDVVRCLAFADGRSEPRVTNAALP